MNAPIIIIKPEIAILKEQIESELGKKVSPLLEGIVSILHVFSCRLHGLRKYKGKIRDDESLQDRT